MCEMERLNFHLCQALTLHIPKETRSQSSRDRETRTSQTEKHPPTPKFPQELGESHLTSLPPFLHLTVREHQSLGQGSRIPHLADAVCW